MLALTYHGSHDVLVDTVPDPILQEPNDILLKITYGGVPDGQAEYVRVAKANVGPIKIPDTLADEQVLFLNDILPTRYQATVNADVGPLY